MLYVYEMIDDSAMYEAVVRRLRLRKYRWGRCSMIKLKIWSMPRMRSGNLRYVSKPQPQECYFVIERLRCPVNLR